MLGVEIGLSNAVGEITLVFFSTVAPAATLAYLLMCALLASPKTSEADRRRLHRQLWIPLVLAMLGLIASATHLGNPANALYVLSHVGGSPLSNEVLAAVAFLALAAVLWLSGFALTEMRRLHLALMSLATATGIAFILMVAFAYDVETIVTWHQTAVPVSIVASAVAAGPLIALFTTSTAALQTRHARYENLLVGIAIIGAAAWLAAETVWGMELAGTRNALFAAAELVPAFWPCLAASALLLVAACANAVMLLRFGRRHFTARLAASALLALLSIFIMRFVFYMLHLTVGLGV